MIDEIAVAALQQSLADAHEARWRMIDVRSASEFASGHIPGAINIPLPELESRKADLPSGALLLICLGGQRAQIAANLLAAERAELTVLTGGTRAWIAAGGAVVSNVATRWSLERQVRLIAGVGAFLGAMLAFFVHPQWLWLSAFFGAGLTFAGLTDLCPMGILLAHAPWNQPAKQ